MRKPSKYEKETIVNFNEAEQEATIYTFNADLKRRLAEFSQKYPLLPHGKSHAGRKRDLCSG